MKNYQNKSVGEVVTALPEAMSYFKQIGIDYCCGGYRPLTEAIKEVKLVEEEVYAQLERFENKSQPSVSFDQMSVAQLCDYIVNKHHVYLREALPRINDYMNAVMRAHGAQHPELFSLGSEFGKLNADLQQHLIKEEEVLFVMLKQQEEKEAEPLANTIIHEHEEAGEILLKLRKISNNYTLPSDACNTFAKLYRALQEMEDDLHTHIHLENNILLKKLDER